VIGVLAMSPSSQLDGVGCRRHGGREHFTVQILAAVAKQETKAVYARTKPPWPLRRPVRSGWVTGETCRPSPRKMPRRVSPSDNSRRQTAPAISIAAPRGNAASMPLPPRAVGTSLPFNSRAMAPKEAKPAFPSRRIVKARALARASAARLCASLWLGPALAPLIRPRRVSILIPSAATGRRFPLADRYIAQHPLCGAQLPASWPPTAQCAGHTATARLRTIWFR
jgi:hypothetical protein